MTKVQGAPGWEITEIWYYKQQVIVDKRSQSYYRTDTGFMTIINRIFRKFLIFERSDRLRHHTRIPRIRAGGKCGQMRDEPGARVQVPAGAMTADAGKCAPSREG